MPSHPQKIATVLLLYINYEPFLSLVNFLGEFNPKSDRERQGYKLYSDFQKMQLKECMHWSKTFLLVFLEEEVKVIIKAGKPSKLIAYEHKKKPCHRPYEAASPTVKNIE